MKKKNNDLKITASMNGDQLSVDITDKLFPTDENHDGIHKKIISAKIVKGDMMQVKFSYVAPDGVKYIGNLSPEGIIHPDMRACLTRLIPHLINICEQIESPLKESDILADPQYISEVFKQYSIEGFSIHGSGDDESVSVFGNKLIEAGEISLCSPAIAPTCGYDYRSEFFELIEAARYEAERYLNGKFAMKQQVMDFEQMEEQAAQ